MKHRPMIKTFLKLKSIKEVPNLEVIVPKFTFLSNKTANYDNIPPVRLPALLDGLKDS